MDLLIRPLAILWSGVMEFFTTLGSIGYLLLDTLRFSPRNFVDNQGRLLGWMTVANLFLGITQNQYINHTFDVLKIRDFVTGLVKAGVFGAIISALACHLGLNVTGGAQGVGVATTRTVVLTIVALIAVDLV